MARLKRTIWTWLMNLHDEHGDGSEARAVGAAAGVVLAGIQRFTRNTLFDEKIGGTVHLALGASFPSTGGRNQSALHWDMDCDLREGGEVWVDGELFVKDEQFVV